MSATAILAACALILPANTPLVQVAIQKGISLDAQPDGTPAFPALQLNSPTDRGQRVGIGPEGPYEPIRQVHAKYVDLPGSRTYEQALADGETALEQMLDNALSNITLTTTVGMLTKAACVEIDSWEKHLDDAIRDIGFGFPVVSGYLILTVRDFWVRYTQTA